MEKVIFDYKYKKIHFIGVCGVSMSGLALHLNSLGFKVSGSDISNNLTLKRLKNKGILTFNKHSPSNLEGVDLVVYSSAIDENNPEIVEAKKQNIPLLKRSQLLGQILSTYKNSIAVSGCHGKTTTTAMINLALEFNNLDPTVFIGGNYKKMGNYKKGSSSFAVVEACEFKKNFLDLSPKYAVVLNIDNDHLDCYKNMQEIKNTFSSFIDGAISIINIDDCYAKDILNFTTLTFGINNKACFMAKKLKFNGRGYSFSVYAYSTYLGRVKLKVLGKHNVYNALATIALTETLKLPFLKTKLALESFSGVERRNQFLGSLQGCDFYADYAHHPKEINSTLSAFNSLNKPYGVVFQPHTYSRTKYLMEEFILALKGVKDLIIYKTFPAREKFDKEGCAKTLYHNLKESGKETVYYANDIKELKNALIKLKEKYKIIVFLGAGDIYDIAKKLLKIKKL